jgi:L-amino acid N-acyltransferase YncA
MTTTFREARLDDAAAIARIYNQGIEDRGATFETEPRRAEDIAEKLSAQARYPFLVAVDGDTVVGWASLSSYRPRGCYDGIAEFSIYLDRDVRGRGLGRHLLTALIDVARARGYWKLVSRIFPFNAASRALCRACGFREVGTYESHGRLDGRWLDVVIVERVIHENLARASAMQDASERSEASHANGARRRSGARESV